MLNKQIKRDFRTNLAVPRPLDLDLDLALGLDHDRERDLDLDLDLDLKFSSHGEGDRAYLNIIQLKSQVSTTEDANRMKGIVPSRNKKDNISM